MFKIINIFKYANFNVLALCRLMGKLRGEQVCICDTSQLSTCDSYNWTILVLFSNDVEWVLRSLRDDDAIKSNETNILLLTSEVATLKYIKINNIILVLEVFAYKQVRPLFLVWMRLTNQTTILGTTMLAFSIFLWVKLTIRLCNIRERTYKRIVSPTYLKNKRQRLFSSLKLL